MLNKKRLIKRFTDYVKIASPSGDEANFAKRLVFDLKKLGLKPTRDRIGNIFVRIKGNLPGAPTIMLNAHIDTVSPGKNIKPRIIDGNLRSNGKTILGADNKAGVAAIIEALTIIKEQDLPYGNILLVFTVQEETGLHGSKVVDRKKIKADYGFVFDGGSPNMIHNAAPAQKNIEAWVIGRAAHAGVHPEHGINAIKVASVAIANMKLGRIDRETTANIGIIQGGKATNIIPPKVYLKGEARSRNTKKLKKQLQHMVSCLNKACRKYKARLHYKINDIYESFVVSRHEKVMRIAKRAINNTGLSAKIKASGGGSDANIFNKYRVPSIILGVGAHELHGVKERLSIKEFVLGTQLILELIKECSKKQ
ncbi:MAG: M20/M25/M40 family metallo-hydrolase [Candidatus Saganbacteria bacterium]|nr:M20/M25/M40 family metallo-hydrolase [Candidatus Saganbacteria bacterium]